MSTQTEFNFSHTDYTSPTLSFYFALRAKCLYAIRKVYWTLLQELNKGWVRGLHHSTCICVILHNTYISTSIYISYKYTHLIVLFFSVVPSSSPTSIQATDGHSSSITVQWGAVDCIHRNGDITGYSVQYGVQGVGGLRL